MGIRGGVRALKDRACLPGYQADATVDQANPVSTTLYEWSSDGSQANKLGTQKNVIIWSADAEVTWAGTQPNPMVIIVTIDGVAHTHTQANPVSATAYYATIHSGAAAANQTMGNVADALQNRPLYVGRKVKITVSYTGAAVTPTNLNLRVKWSKW